MGQTIEGGSQEHICYVYASLETIDTSSSSRAEVDAKKMPQRIEEIIYQQIPFGFLRSR